MAKILVNDGMSDAGLKIMTDAGLEVFTSKIPQDDLMNELKNYDAILVRSATTVRKDLIDATPNLKFIGRAGVGMDNIDVAYAREKGINVANTPAASSLSVAELAIAHLFAGARFIHQSNREMYNGDFNSLKKKYSKGIELKGKTLGILGFGKIGQETAKLALGLGMKILAYDLKHISVDLPIHIEGVPNIKVQISTTTKEDVLKNADFISIHVPFKKGETPCLTNAEFRMMKNGVMIINCGRGGSVDEDALLNAFNLGKVTFAGIDVFENEPTPKKELIEHPYTSVTPHIGGSTIEAQDRVGIELAQYVVDFFKK